MDTSNVLGLVILGAKLASRELSKPLWILGPNGSRCISFLDFLLLEEKNEVLELLAVLGELDCDRCLLWVE